MAVSVYRRDGSPYYYFDYTPPGSGSKRHRVSTRRTNKREAEKVAEIEARRMADEAQITGKVITLRAALSLYVTSLEVAKKAYARNAATLRDKALCAPRDWSRGVAPKFCLAGDMEIHRLQPSDLRQLHTARLSEGNALQTANHEVALVRAAVRHAKEHGYKAADLTIRLEKPGHKTRYLSWPEFERVYAWMAPTRPIRTRGAATWVPTKGSVPWVQRQDAQDLLVALCMTGGRWMEVAGLTWSQVDIVHWTQIRLYGEKTAQERTVPIPGIVRDMFVRRRDDRDGLSDLVFPGEDNKLRAQPSKAIADAMDDCGLNSETMVARHGRATVHSLRHTFASWLLQQGVSLPEVQALMGHASFAMTLRYAQLARAETINKATAALDRMVPGTPTEGVVAGCHTGASVVESASSEG